MVNTKLVPQPGSRLLLLPEEHLEEISKLLKEAVKQGIKENSAEELQEKLLSPKEVCKLFQPNISVVTLNSWTAKRYLTKYTIGSRTYYKYSEVLNALKTLKRYSRNYFFNN